MAYTFDQIFAADPSNPERVASNGLVTIFTPGDTTKFPVQIRTVEGMVIQNPVQLNDSGHGPAFTHETLDRVAWEGGGFSGFLTSYDGMKRDATASAVSAEAARVAAEAAARNMQAPTKEAIQQALTTEGPAKEALEASISQRTAAFALKPDNGGKPVGKGELVANVRDYGARGDGVIDDTAAVQAAVTGGSKIYFPDGEYLILGTIVLHSDLELFGAPGAVIRKSVGSANYTTFFAPAGRVPGYGAIRNIYIHNLTFRGDLANGVSICALAAHRLSGLTVDQCRFLETSQNGHVFDLMGCDDVVIKNSEFRGIKRISGRGYTEAIQLDSSIRIGISFGDELAATELFDGTPTKNVTVRNNRFGPITVGGVTYPAQSPIGSHSYVDGRPYTNINFIENEIEGVVETDGSYPGIVHFVAAQDVTIARNTVRAGSVPTNGFVRFLRGGSAIRQADVGRADAANTTPTTQIDPANIRVTGNLVEGLSQPNAQVWLYGAVGSRLTDVTIADNRFNACQAGADSGYLVQVTHTDKLRITGNAATGCGRGFIYVDGAGAPVIANNAGDGGGWHPLNMNSCEGPAIRNNTFVGYPLPVQVVRSKDVVISANEVTVTADVAALSITSPPSPPGFVQVVGNTIAALSAASSAPAITVDSNYITGVVSMNVCKNYAVSVSTLTGVVVNSNVRP